MRMSGVLLVLVSLCLLVSIGVGWADTIELQLKHSSPEEQKEGTVDFAGEMESQEISFPEGNVRNEEFESLVKKEPEYKCKTPFRVVYTLGTGKYLAAFDSSDLQEDGFNIAHFDTNGNGDLTDDSPLIATATQRRYGNGYNHRHFPAAEVRISCGDGEIDYRFALNVYSYFQRGTIAYGGARLHSRTYREGKGTLDGKEIHLVLLDNGSNGLFNDYAAVKSKPSGQQRVFAQPFDLLFADPDLNKTNYAGYDAVLGRTDCYPVAQRLALGEKYYQLQITPSGDKVTLTPFEGETGAVKNSSKRFSALVYDASGIVKISSEDSKPVALPVGNWNLVNCLVDLTDYSQKVEGRYPFTFSAARATGEYPEVEVSSGATVEMPFGAPYSFRVTASPRGDTCSLSLSFLGAGGEICDTMLVNGNYPPEPNFVIATAKGKVIERGTFEFG